jgi:hypothetical protein
MAGIATGDGANAQAGISMNGHALNPRHLEKGIIIPAAEASSRGTCGPLTGTQTAKVGGSSIATAEWSAMEYWLGSASGRQVPKPLSRDFGCSRLHTKQLQCFGQCGLRFRVFTGVVIFLAGSP